MHSQGGAAAAEQQGHCPAAQPQDSLPVQEAGAGAMPCIAEAEGDVMELTSQGQARPLRCLQSCPESARGSEAPEQTMMIPTLWDCPSPHHPALSTHMYKSRSVRAACTCSGLGTSPTTPFQPASLQGKDSEKGLG